MPFITAYIPKILKLRMCEGNGNLIDSVKLILWFPNLVGKCFTRKAIVVHNCSLVTWFYITVLENNLLSMLEKLVHLFVFLFLFLL